jgi:protein-S-isoprenylcysteine O-methyltransferase Ste14
MRKIALAVVVLLIAAGADLIIAKGTRSQSLAVGTILLVTAIPLLLVSRIQLGRAFSVAPKASILVTRGLYSKIPHPMYAFLDLALLGIIIAMRSPWAIMLWLAVVVVQGWQARREAKVLEHAFGEAYRKYRDQAWW